MKPDRKPKYRYEVRIDQPDHLDKYAHLSLMIHAGTYGHNPLVTMTWQANRLTADDSKVEGTWLEGWSGWYGMDIKIDAHTLLDLKEATAAACAALGNQEPWACPVLDDVLQRLAKKKATFVEVLYDARLGQQVPVDDILPEEYTAWLDDNQRMGNTYATTCVLARTEEEAQKKMIIALVEGGYDHILEQFISAGKPLRPSHNDGPKDRRHAIVRLGIQEAQARMTIDQAVDELETIEQE